MKKISGSLFNDRIATALKGLITPPMWSLYVKTSSAKQTVPTQKDWWYRRAASVLRKIILYGNDKVLGVGRLSKMFSSGKNRGAKPTRSTPAGTKIIRTILNQLEDLGFSNRYGFGRRITGTFFNWIKDNGILD